MKIRQDAWSHEDDLLLAETVLRHIRTGSTQLNAFEEVGDKLNRTSAACGFRWNAEVRQKYDQAMEIAKKQRKERKRVLAGQSQPYNNQVQVQVQTIHSPGTALFQHEHYNQEQPAIERQIDNTVEMANEINLDTIISYLQNIKITGLNSQTLRSENERLTRDNKGLLSERERLEKKLQRLIQQNDVIQEDYQSLLQIMDRARRMVSFNEDEERRPLDQHTEGLGQIAK